MKIEKLFSMLNEIAPESLQEDWDNSGIQICNDSQREIKRIMTCLELSDAVVDEAVEKHADVVITHHPLLFSRINAIKSNDVAGNQIIKLIKNDIDVYSSHTSFDSASHGTNQDLAEQLHLTDISPIIPSKEYPGCGMGRYGFYEEPVSFSDFIDDIAEVCPDAEIRVAGMIPEYIKKAALCTGAGSEFIDEAALNGADVFITGDLKYHDARHADDIGFCVVDAGHYGTEVLFARNMANLLVDIISREKINDIEIFVSETNIDPFR